MEKVFHLVGRELVYGRPHRFQVRLYRECRHLYAEFSTGGYAYPPVQITREQWEAFERRHSEARTA